jgi:hypothetical protein
MIFPNGQINIGTARTFIVSILFVDLSSASSCVMTIIFITIYCLSFCNLNAQKRCYMCTLPVAVGEWRLASNGYSVAIPNVTAF